MNPQDLCLAASEDKTLHPTVMGQFCHDNLADLSKSGRPLNSVMITRQTFLRVADP